MNANDVCNSPYLVNIDNTWTEVLASSCFLLTTRLDKGVIVYICDSSGVRDIYDTDGSNAVAASEPLAVLVLKTSVNSSCIYCRSFLSSDGSSYLCLTEAETTHFRFMKSFFLAFLRPLILKVFLA